MGLFDSLFGKRDAGQPFADTRHLLEKIEVIPGLKIPKAFAQHWSSIEKTRLSFASIDATPASDMALEQSKFGHLPCLPLDFEYPRDEKGNFMYPLAQINCKELPALNGYPDSGFLQFYISGFDDVYGLNFNDPQLQKNFRVLYFEEDQVINYKADFSFLDEVMKTDRTPVFKPYALSFIKKDAYVGPGDVRCEGNKSFNLLPIAQLYPSIEQDLEDSIYGDFATNGHKVGGYAYFTQTDPREYGKKFKDFILLLQIDSDEDIMWGDAGVANFFIHPDDLAKKDFSKVLYNWDCS